jgi:mannose-6-phosphate isomerase
MPQAEQLPPLRFEPILKARAWGGRRLSTLGKTLPPEEIVGESWELADLPVSIPDGRSVVAEGTLQGESLHSLLSSHEHSILGALHRADTGGFPLLVKFLDAQDNLSVQVHPDATYASNHQGAFLKSETWFVLEAAPDSYVYRGVKPDVDRKAFQEAILQGTALDCMVRLPAQAGDCIRLPSGTCHALGAGVLAAEIQTPSDTTFRVWDWNRDDPNRPLHIEQAMEAMHFGAQQADEASARVVTSDIPPVVREGIASRRICTMAEFTIDLIDIDESTTHAITGDDTPVVLLCVEGAGKITSPAGNARFEKGDVVLVPARNCQAHIQATRAIRFLHTDLPVAKGTLLA